MRNESGGSAAFLLLKIAKNLQITKIGVAFENSHLAVNNHLIASNLSFGLSATRLFKKIQISDFILIAFRMKLFICHPERVKTVDTFCVLEANR